MRQRESVCIPEMIFSISLTLALLLFSGRGMAEQTVKTGAHFTEQPNMAEIRQDLNKIDSYSADGGYVNASVIVGRSIKARDIYRSYLERAAVLSGGLLKVRQHLDLNDRSMTLQELGAMTQRLSAENLHFRGSFHHGEERFQTYRLIEKAITNLEDALNYWRAANKYRPLYRGSAREVREDDEVLRIKLQTAVNAIDELKIIEDTREALSKDLTEDN
jgi:glutamate mutase epsilon subunit